MEQNSSSLKYVHISKSADTIVDYIDKRRKNEIRSLSTPWRKFNEICMGGIEWNTITTIAGMSGSGKTAIQGQLETGLKYLNPKEDFAILSFGFEMLSSRMVGRKLSNRLKLTTQQLYSGKNDFELTDQCFDQVQKEAKSLSKYDIYYVDIPGNAKQIENTIMKFATEEWMINSPKGIMVFLDHTLLVKKLGNSSDKDLLYDLMCTFNKLKKLLKISFVLLSQMNRNIESSERIQNPSLHFPSKQDIFGADACYMYSDVVLVTHRPEMLGIPRYGVKGWTTKDLLFWHYLKVREGEPCIAAMVNNLKHNEVLDYVPENQNDDET